VTKSKEEAAKSGRAPCQAESSLPQTSRLLLRQPSSTKQIFQKAESRLSYELSKQGKVQVDFSRRHSGLLATQDGVSGVALP